MTEKLHFTEEEKDKIIEQLLVEKPWLKGIKYPVYRFIRKYLLTMCSFFIASSFIISRKHLGISGEVASVLVLSTIIFCFVWDLKITPNAPDLKMTDRDFVTLAVKGGKVGNLAEIKRELKWGDASIKKGKKLFYINSFIFIVIFVLGYCPDYFSKKYLFYIVFLFVLFNLLYAQTIFKFFIGHPQTILENGMGDVVDQLLQMPDEYHRKSFGALFWYYVKFLINIIFLLILFFLSFILSNSAFHYDYNIAYFIVLLFMFSTNVYMMRDIWFNYVYSNIEYKLSEIRYIKQRQGR